MLDRLNHMTLSPRRLDLHPRSAATPAKRKKEKERLGERDYEGISPPGEAVTRTDGMAAHKRPMQQS